VGFGVKVLKRIDTKAIPDDFDLHQSRYGFGVSWEQLGGRDVDIDLQCVVVNREGSIIDCAYYNNLKAAGAITHSGDESHGKPDHIAEMVWVNTRKLQQDVSLLVFVVAAYSGGQLKDVANGMLHVMEERQTNEVARFEMEQSAASVDVVATMYKESSGRWKLRIIDLPAQTGQHFMDILPLLSDTIRLFIPTAPRRQKVAFAMEKGGILDLPQSLDAITIGLGWDVDDGEVDLDVSAVMLDCNTAEVETVFFGNLESSANGIFHTGDNLTGHGDGDDEQIRVSLMRVTPRVQQIVFVINIYTARRTFRQVANPYCRVVDNATGAELCKYMLREAGNETGLIVAKMMREAGDRWGFHALGLPCRGQTFKDSLPQIRQQCQSDTRLLMARGGTMDLHSYGSSLAKRKASVEEDSSELSDTESESADGACGRVQASCSVM